MIVLITGGRDFTDRDFLFGVMDASHRAEPITMVIEGGQRKRSQGEIIGGADYWANQWAKARGIPITTVTADWDTLSHPDAVIKTGAGGKKYDAMAGPRRNARMLALRPIKVIGFSGGSGTEDMLRQARAAGINTVEVRA